jgi:ADP-ribosylglycohydrolase
MAGCLLGGAVGDALGAPLEFLSLAQIRELFGPGGLQRYAPAYGRLGAITDDTQMSLFTAEGLIRGARRYDDRGICNPAMVIWHAYLRWLGTQGEMHFDPEFPPRHDGWLWEVPELHHHRGAGNTCLSALRQGQFGTIEEPVNDSKGCGGVMRVAPVGLVAAEPFRLGCQVAAITHGHPSGYLAAGFLAQVISEIFHGRDLQTAISAAREELVKWPRHEECLAAVDAALRQADTAEASPEDVERLGQGWVAEEALAIALFCALKAEDFLHGVLLAVNHSGDSDSTGAITGNILGTLWGRSAIPENLLHDLELRPVIEQLSEDLTRLSDCDDPERYPTW